MKLLHVWGYDDYAAVAFEEMFGNEEEYAALWEVINREEDKQKEYMTEDANFYITAVEFDVESSFIQFLRSEQMLDYDACKHTNIYEV